MSSLIPNYSLSEFKKLRADELAKLKCCEVFADGEYLFTFVRGNIDYIRIQTEGLGVKANAVDGEELKTIKGERHVETG